MSTSYSPRLVTDGLQLYYDVNNIKSYPGEPTTNAWSNIVAGTNSAVTSGLTFAGKTDVYKLECTSPSTNVTLTNSFTGGVMTLGEYYSISFDYYLPSSNTVLGWLQVLGAATGDGYTNFGTTSTTTDTWLKAEFSVAATVGNDWGFYMYLRGGTIPLGEHAYVTNIQFERSQPHVTQYLPSGTTRSTTDGLKDLSGQGNHANLANAGFDSNALLDFNNSNLNYIPITTLLNAEAIGASTTKTISFWFNPGVLSSYMAFSTGQTGDDRIYMWTSSNLHTWRVGNYTTTSGHSTLTVDTWYYTTLVIDGNNLYVYLNGQLDYSGTYASFTTAHYATLGRHGEAGAYYFNGKIDVVQIYTKALSAQEVLQNYNALKGRYI